MPLGGCANWVENSATGEWPVQDVLYPSILYFYSRWVEDESVLRDDTARGTCAVYWVHNSAFMKLTKMRWGAEHSTIGSLDEKIP